MPTEFPLRPEPADRPTHVRTNFERRTPARRPRAWKSLQSSDAMPTDPMRHLAKQSVRHTIRRLLVIGLGLLLVFVGVGCRMFDRMERDKDGGSGNRHSDVATRDPLMGGRLIPKQDIPIPGRSDLAESKDPLLRAGSASNRDRREPFQLGPENTSAATASDRKSSHKRSG